MLNLQRYKVIINLVMENTWRGEYIGDDPLGTSQRDINMVET
jgi:hypothetical protein